MDWGGVVKAARDWQDLVGAIVGSAVLVYTVYVTLTTERRRRDQETQSLRVALGAEVRQFAGRAINAHGAVCMRLRSVNPPKMYARVTIAQLQGDARFPEPVIYPNSADRLGVLGPTRVHDVVYFFGQIAVVRDVLSLLVEAHGSGASVPADQISNLAEALLRAAEAGVRTFPAFPFISDPEKIREATERARADFDAGRSTRRPDSEPSAQRESPS